MTNEPIPKKALGQHWLADPVSLDAMCTAAAVSAIDVVLEIGPGLGTLTERLAAQAQEVVAVEFDESLAKDLPSRLTAKNVRIEQADILRFDLTSLPKGYKVVANIPYYLTSHLIRVLSESANPPTVAALLVQKEVAERVAAEPGDMSLLSVTAQFYWKVSLGQFVPAKLFTPPPKVDSQILVLHRCEGPLFSDVAPRDFFRVVRAGFSQRRKTLLNSLSAGLHLARADVERLLLAVEVEPSRRAQSLNLEEWHRIVRRVYSL